MTPLPITDYTLTSSLGLGRLAHRDRLLAGESGLKPCDFDDVDLTTWIGEVPGVDEQTLPEPLREYDCRNNRLAWLALQQDDFIARARDAVARYGANRVGIFTGTSTSGIHQTELAYREADEAFSALPDRYIYSSTHNIYSLADFVQRALGATGLCLSISTACSSSAKVFASARRAMASGQCDAAIVGGVDSLCLTTLYGFHSLQLVARDKCRPFDANRTGISIGEAGGFALLEPGADSPLALLGYGESGDAHHMSAPHPEGEGARLAMAQALARAGVTPQQVDYVNLHGTGTPANDLAESRAINALFDTCPWVSSTKGWTGHTLGAAGIIEAGFSLLCLEHQFVPANLHLEQQDPAIDIRLPRTAQRLAVKRVLSNSFGFGGSNCSLLLGENA